MTRHKMTDPLKQALQQPLSLRLTPLMGADFVHSDQADRFAIYTEPPEAPGRDEVYAALRAGLQRESGRELPQGDVPIDGETLGNEDWEPGIAFETDWDTDEICGQVLFYRLVLTDDLAPIGFCSFEVNADETGIVAVTLVEAWIEQPYRHRGLGAGFVSQIAAAVYDTVAEVDARIPPEHPGPRDIGVLLSQEGGSTTGESLLEALATLVEDAFMGAEDSGAAPLRFLRVTAVNVA